MSDIEVDLSGRSYAFAVPCYDGRMHAETAVALMRTTKALTERNIPWYFLLVKGNALIDSVRNELVRQFRYETNATTLVFIDSDISWEPDSMGRLMAFSALYPIVSGLYASRREPIQYIVSPLENKLNEHGLLPHNGAGFGFVAIQREVFDKIPVETYESNEGKMVDQFFKVGVRKGKYTGEDMYFYKDAHDAGITAYADPGIHLKHHGEKIYEGNVYQALKEKILKE